MKMWRVKYISVGTDMYNIIRESHA